MGAAAGTAGAGLLVGGLASRGAQRGARERGPVDTWKDVTVAAPRELVFALWTRHENFPRFLSRLLEVKDLGRGRSRWTAAGPDGPVRWNVRLTQRVAGRLLAWESLPRAAVRNAGTLRFEDAGDGATRVSVHLTHEPPAGALAPLAARLFGADPRGSLDEDVRRMKAFVEMAAAPGAAADLR